MPFEAAVAFIQGIPESLVFVLLVFAFMGAAVPGTRIVLLGLLNHGLLVIVRGAGAPFPAHVLFVFVVVSVAISLWEHIALYRVIYAWVFAMAILILSETCLSMLVSAAMGMPLAELAAYPWLWALVGLPHIAVMALIAWWASRRGGVRPCKARESRPGGRSA